MSTAQKTTAVKMPSFKIRKPDITMDEVASLSSNKGKFLDPGRHDVKIKSVELTKQNDKDPTFYNYKVTYENAAGATTRKTFLVPTESLKYAGSQNKNGQLFPYTMLAELFRALGETVTPATIWEHIVNYFGKNKLVGKTLSIDIGYTKAHVAYISKDNYELRDRNGNPILGANGGPVTGAKNEVLKEAIILGLNGVQEYSEITGHVPAEPKAEEDTDDAASEDEDVF